MKIRSWLVAFTTLAACQFGDNESFRTHPDGGAGHDSKVIDTTNDAKIDAPGVTSCTIVPQGGCSGSTPACDIHDDATTYCRGVTKEGTSNSHCVAETECKTRYTCTGDGVTAHPKWCARFCATDSDCLGDGSRCLNELESNGTPLGARVCTNACNPITQTGCPSGMGCLVVNHATGDFSDCMYMDGKALGAACVYSDECSNGLLCVGNSSGATCRQLCQINAANTCPSGKTCSNFGTPIEIASAVYGYCN